MESCLHFPICLHDGRENVNCRSEFRGLIKYHSAERVLKAPFFSVCLAIYAVFRNLRSNPHSAIGNNLEFIYFFFCLRHSVR